MGQKRLDKKRADKRIPMRFRGRRKYIELVRQTYLANVVAELTDASRPVDWESIISPPVLFAPAGPHHHPY